MSFPCLPVQTNNSAKANEFYKRLGMNDKNGNGVIDKNFSFHNWALYLFVDEGYKKEIDLNNDGEITGTEAKLYYIMHFPKTLDAAENSNLTPEDIKGLSLAAENIRNRLLSMREALEFLEKSMEFFEDIKNLAIKSAQNGNFKEAQEIIEILDLLSKNLIFLQSSVDEAYFVIGRRMSEAGLFNGALKVAEKIESDSTSRNFLFFSIAVDMAQAKLFKDALKIAKSIEDSDYYQSKAFFNIISFMRIAGLNENEIGKIFNEVGINNLQIKRNLP